MSSTSNHVRLSKSGLLVEIETYENGVLTGAVQIDRQSWPHVVANVEACMREARVMAQIDNIVADTLDTAAP